MLGSSKVGREETRQEVTKIEGKPQWRNVQKGRT